MNDDDFKLLRGFGFRWMDRIMDICESRVNEKFTVIKG